MNYDELKQRLLHEHKRSYWGMLLVFHDEFFQDLNDAKIMLDVGCNAQMLKRTVLERKPDVFVVGLDIVNYSCSKAEKVDVLASGEALPFRDECFEYVSMVESLEHMDSWKAVAEAYRVLKHDGRIFVQSVHKDDPAYPNDPTHVTPLDEQVCQEMFKAFKEASVKRICGTLLIRAVK